ncbi:unnamed protein product [Rotaria magnacalcarata]|uniref:Poly [ADP-ribose] polymerase n=1 Tax=Rotaria magnacalcarata TaxID=392030 RepID=A0A819PFE0_9BILA|nr:unnamed protein product [Rotaria magnacalcarata]
MLETAVLTPTATAASLKDDEAEKSATTANSLNKKKFDGDGLAFNGTIIGMKYLSIDRDEKMCLDSMFELKASRRDRGEPKQKIKLNLTMGGIKLIDDNTKTHIATHETERISFVVIDPRDTRSFGYIYHASDERLQLWAIKTERAATVTVRAIKEVFELTVEQLTNDEKAKAANKSTVMPSSSVSYPKQALQMQAPPQTASTASTTTQNVPVSMTSPDTYVSSQSSPAPLSTNDTNSPKLINVRKGDLTTEQSNVIVVCSSSQYLLDNILKAGGDTLKMSYDNESKQNSSALIAVVAGGQLLSKKVYFLPWRPNTDETLLCASLKKFVSDAIEKATAENYQSIAFPAIGCGQFGCSASLVAKTLVGEAFRLVAINAINVSFIVQPDKDSVFHEFQQQINLLRQLEKPSEIPTMSISIGKGMLLVEKGNITTQKVDAIVGSSSSEILKQAIIEAAGPEVKAAYETEYKNYPNAILISTIPGKLPCKRIFFLKWQPNPDDSKLRQSIVDFIWTVIQNVISHNYTSIAFPAIGCGKHGCSVDIIVKTMVQEIKKQLEMRDFSLTVKFMIQPEQQSIYDEFCKQVLTSEKAQGKPVEHKLPTTWVQSTDNRVRFVVSNNTDEYHSVVTNFDKTMKGKYTQIIQIERIQNERWFMQYLAHSEDFKKRLNSDTEKRLYHGCPQDAANLIIEDCFNRRIAYGVGVYFSSNAAYSHNYTTSNSNEERCMFVSRVLIGKTIKGDSSMKTRPLGFDSTTDGNHIFVTYHDAQSIAEYLITYK